MQKIILIGNEIFADILYGYLKYDSRYKVVAFSVDSDYIKEEEKFNLPVIDLNKLKDLYPASEHNVVMAVGYKKINQVRSDLFDRAKKMGYEIQTYIHPQSFIFNDDMIGEGSVILSGTTIEPYVKIGENSVIWANCVVGHHSQIENHCWVASGTVLAGQTKIGNNCFLGVNATVSNQVTLGEFNIIGSNCAVHKNTQNNEVYLSHQGEKHRFSATDYDQFFLK